MADVRKREQKEREEIKRRKLKEERGRKKRPLNSVWKEMDLRKQVRLLHDSFSVGFIE